MLYSDFWVGDLNGTLEKVTSSKRNPGFRDYVYKMLISDDMTLGTVTQ